MSYKKIGVMESGDGVEIFKIIEGEDYPYLGIAETDDGFISTRWDESGLNEFNAKLNFYPDELVGIGDIVVGKVHESVIPVIGRFIEENDDGFLLADFTAREVLVEVIAPYVEPEYGISQDHIEDDAPSVKEYINVVGDIVDMLEKGELGKSKCRGCTK